MCEISEYSKLVHNYKENNICELYLFNSYIFLFYT